MNEKLKERLLKYLRDKKNGSSVSNLASQFGKEIELVCDELVSTGDICKKRNNVGSGKNDFWFFVKN